MKRDVFEFFFRLERGAALNHTAIDPTEIIRLLPMKTE